MVFEKEVEFFEPPARKELAAFEYVVVNSNTPRAETTYDKITEAFKSARIGSNPYFRAVYYDAGNMPPGSLASTATFNLSIAEPVASIENVVENHFRCPGDKAVRSCDSNEAIHYSVNCQINTVRVSANYTIKNAKNGKQIYTDHTSITENSKACSDSGGSPTPISELVYKAKEKLGVEIAGMFTPAMIERPNDLIDEDDSLLAHDQAQLESAFKNASEGRIEHAIFIYSALLTNHPENASLLFNLGYCHQALGNFQEANKHYRKAISFAPEKISDLEKYATEVETWLAKGELRIARK